MQYNRGPEQTDMWPEVWADLDPSDPPAWVVWNRTCQSQAENGAPCPRRAAGMHFGVRRCDRHLVTLGWTQIGPMIG
jgi:hypothetical protein